MQLAFCYPPVQDRLHRPSRRLLSTRTGTSATSPRCAAKRRDPGSASEPRPKSKRAKRPRSRPTSGFSTPPTEEAPRPSTEQSPEAATEPATGPDLQKRDAGGISLENRLREEIAHPLRKPKLTLFGTLAFSATIGALFALARLARGDDTPAQVAQNVAVDTIAVGLFGYLAWREVQFGRRSLNSLAGRPEARDLQVMVLDEKATQAAPVVGDGSGRRLGSLFREKDVVVVAGRAIDVRKYLNRVHAGEGGVNLSVVIALPTDAQRQDDAFEGAAAVASGEADNTKDWTSWIGDAVPPRRNVALFSIEAGDKGQSAANTYVVAVGDPMTLPLPADAKRESADV